MGHITEVISELAQTIKDSIELLLIVVAFMVILLLSTCTPAKADSLLLGGVSYHMMSEDVNNSFHRAFIYEKGGYAFGYLRNSHSNDSFVGAYKLWEDIDKDITTDIYAGAVRGYERCYGDFKKDDTKRKKVIACPIIFINVTVRTDTLVQPVISLWGDAIVVSGKVNF